MNLETSNDIQGTADQSQFGFEVSDQALADEQSDAPGLDEYLENGYDYEAPKRGDIRDGVIVGSNDYGLIVDIGFKREGLVPTEDLERLDEETRAEVQVGSSVPVFVLRPENREGYPVLSIHQARLYEDWLKAEQMMEEAELYEGEVSGCNRGGLIVQFGKIRGFVPASHVVGLPRRLSKEKRRRRLESMIGETMGLKIIEVDRKRRRLIFSQRRAFRAWQELQRERVMEELTEGEVRQGKVTSITDFGAFVDLGGADGLIHISELSWGRVDDPHEVLSVGDEIDVHVLDVDQKRKRIALSLKELQPDPWDLVDDHYEVGQLIEGRVTRVVDFGAFVELDLGIEGLLHVSEMIGTPELKPSEIVHAGESLLVKVIRINSRRRRIALSAKRVRRSEWERWVAAQQVADKEEDEEEAREAAEAAVDADETAIEAEAEGEIEEEVKAEEPALPEAEAAPEEAPEEALESTESELAAGEVVESDEDAEVEELAASEVEVATAEAEEEVTGEDGENDESDEDAEVEEIDEITDVGGEDVEDVKES